MALFLNINGLLQALCIANPYHKLHQITWNETANSHLKSLSYSISPRHDKSVYIESVIANLHRLYSCQVHYTGAIYSLLNWPRKNAYSYASQQHRSVVQQTWWLRRRYYFASSIVIASTVCTKFMYKKDTHKAMPQGPLSPAPSILFSRMHLDSHWLAKSSIFRYHYTKQW